MTNYLKEKYRIPTDPMPVDIIMFAKSIGSHFFEPETIRYFSSELEQPVYSDGNHGALFVTSEQLTKEVKREIAGGVLRDIDNTFDKLTETVTVRDVDGLHVDEPRQWKVRHANFDKGSIGTYDKYDDYIFVCLADADEAAKATAEKMRNGDDG